MEIEGLEGFQNPQEMEVFKPLLVRPKSLCLQSVFKSYAYSGKTAH